MKILGTTPQAPPGAKATPGGAAGEEGRGAAETPDCLATKFYNNLGAIHFHLRKHHLAAFYFRRAIDANTKATVALSEAKNFGEWRWRPLAEGGGVARRGRELRRCDGATLETGNDVLSFFKLVGEFDSR